jgi:parallel beta-helix repeat protein
MLAGSLGALVVLPQRTSGFPPHDPILIEGDAGFNSTNGVVSGSGTASDPFMIDGWDIQAYFADCLQIVNTTAYFVISNVSAHDGRWSWSGIHLKNATNGIVENCLSVDNNYGIRIVDSPGTIVVNCSFSRSYGGGGMGGVSIERSDSSVVIGCSATNVNSFVEVRDSSDVLVVANSCDCTTAAAAVLVGGSNNTTVADNEIAGAGIGVLLWYATNTTVVNNTVSSCGQGVFVYFSNSTRLIDNTISSSNENGIWLWGSDDITVLNNSLLWSQRFGIYIDRTRNCSISGNVFESDGIVIKGETLADFNSHSITLDNIVSHTGNSTNTSNPIYYFKDAAGLVVDGLLVGQIIIANCTGVSISNMHVTDTDIGLQMGYVNDVVVTGLEISNCLNGIRIYECAGLALLDSHVHGNHGWTDGYGLQLENGVGVAIIGNTFEYNNKDAISLAYTMNTVIAQNEVFSNYQGIILYGGNYYSTIERNNVTSSQYDGILFQGGSHAVIIANNASGNGWSGVYVAFSDNTNVIGNNLSGNYQGVLLNDAHWCSVYHNNFWQNTNFQADQINDCLVSWDNGYPSGGNYWSDYTGVDQYSGPAQDLAGPDGIGDTPRELPGDVNEDRYPLMAPYWASDFPPVAYLNAPELLGDTTTVFEFDASDSWDMEDDPSTLQIRWDWEGDGIWDTDWTTVKNASHQFSSGGTYNVTVEVKDSAGFTDTLMVQVVVIEVIPEFGGAWVVILFVMMLSVIIRKRPRLRV